MVVISNEVGVVVGEGIEASGEEKGDEPGLEGVEEASKVPEDGNRVVEVRKVVGEGVEGEGVGIDGVLDKCVSKLTIGDKIRRRVLMLWGNEHTHNHSFRRVNGSVARVT